MRLRPGIEHHKGGGIIWTDLNFLFSFLAHRTRFPARKTISDRTRLFVNCFQNELVPPSVVKGGNKIFSNIPIKVKLPSLHGRLIVGDICALMVFQEMELDFH